MDISKFIKKNSMFIFLAFGILFIAILYSLFYRVEGFSGSEGESLVNNLDRMKSIFANLQTGKNLSVMLDHIKDNARLDRNDQRAVNSAIHISRIEELRTRLKQSDEDLKNMYWVNMWNKALAPALGMVDLESWIKKRIRAVMSALPHNTEHLQKVDERKIKLRDSINAFANGAHGEAMRQFTSTKMKLDSLGENYGSMPDGQQTRLMEMKKTIDNEISKLESLKPIPVGSNSSSSNNTMGNTSMGNTSMGNTSMGNTSMGNNNMAGNM